MKVYVQIAQPREMPKAGWNPREGRHFASHRDSRSLQHDVGRVIPKFCLIREKNHTSGNVLIEVYGVN